MQQLITWRDLKMIANRLTEEQLNFSLCVNVATDEDKEGEFYGVSDDGSLPRIFFSPDGVDSPLDEEEPFLRLEI